VALTMMDAVISEARASLPTGSTLGSQIVDLISPEAIASEVPARAADALLLVGQLLAVYESDARSKTDEATAAASADRRKRLRSWD